MNKLSKLLLLGAGVAFAWRAWSDKRPGASRGASAAGPRDFFGKAMRSGVAELEVARSGQLRGASAEVRRFALELEHDHEHLNAELAEAAGRALPELDEGQRSVLAQVNDHQGEAFDQAWLRHLARSHAKAIRLFEQAASGDGEAAGLASRALPTLRAHAERVRELQSGGTSASDAA